jgi:DNA-binding CsgD family transcriptional regulator
MELSETEAKAYTRLACEAVEVASSDDFRVWASTSVRQFFPHEALIAGVARREASKTTVDQLLTADFPIAFIDAVTIRRGTFTCPTLESWFRQGRPQFYEPSNTRRGPGREPADEFKAFDLRNVAAHGVPDLLRRSATYFSFSRLPKRPTQRHARHLDLLVPHLHSAYVRAVGASPAGVWRDQSSSLEGTTSLTPRELAVLQQLYRQGSNKSIARALGRSPDTVKHQIHSLLKKLCAEDRACAVTNAIRLGLLPDRRGTEHKAREVAIAN